jgi:hypothetical protein
MVTVDLTACIRRVRAVVLALPPVHEETHVPGDQRRKIAEVARKLRGSGSLGLRRPARQTRS